MFAKGGESRREGEQASSVSGFSCTDTTGKHHQHQSGVGRGADLSKACIGLHLLMTRGHFAAGRLGPGSLGLPPTAHPRPVSTSGRCSVGEVPARRASFLPWGAGAPSWARGRAGSGARKALRPKLRPVLHCLPSSWSPGGEGQEPRLPTGVTGTFRSVPARRPHSVVKSS